MKSNFSDYFDDLPIEETDLRLNTHISSNQSVSSFEVPLPPTISNQFNPNIESFPSQSTDTTSSSMTNIDYAAQTLMLENELKKSENNPDILFKLIYLYKKQNRYIDFENTVTKTLTLCPLSEQIWKDYFHYKISIASTFQQKYALIALFNKCLDDFYYPKVVFKFMKFLINLYNENTLNNIGNTFDEYPEISLQSIEKYFKKFISLCGIDVKNSSKIYDLYLKFEISMNKPKEEIFNIWKERFTAPQIIIDILYKEYQKWEENQSRITIIEDIYHKTQSITMDVIAFDEKFSSIINDSEEDNGNDFVLNLIKENIDFLSKININYVVLYYEKALEKYINDVELWKNYISFINEHKDTVIFTKRNVLKRACRSCNNNVVFTVLYLRELELNKVSIDDIQNEINRCLSLTKDNFISHDNSDYDSDIDTDNEFNIYKCEIIKYNLEFNVRHFILNDTNTNLIRALFTEAINSITSLNMNDYMNTVYHLWAEFECYKAKSVDMLSIVMNRVCALDESMNSFRAYIYYMKAIGNESDVRKVYKKAYDVFSKKEDMKDESDAIKNNWLSYEKLFGSAFNIKETIEYTKTDNNNNSNQSEKNNENKIIIKNIPIDYNENDLSVLLSSKCPLIEAKNIRLVRDDDGTSRRFAFVDFNTNEDAKKAVEGLNGVIINECTLTCAISKEGHNDSRTIFVNHIPLEATKENLLQLFKQYGTVLDVRIIVNPQTNKPKGYCYVEYSEDTNVDKCLSSHQENPIKLFDKELKIERSQSNWKLRNKIKYVAHVVNLNFELDEKELEDFIVSNCEIEKKNIVKILICRDEGRKKKSKGYGFIEFSDRESLQKAINKSGEKVKGRSIVISESKRNITEKKKKEDEVLSRKKRKRSKNDEKVTMSNDDFRKLFDN